MNNTDPNLKDIIAYGERSGKKNNDYSIVRHYSHKSMTSHFYTHLDYCYLFQCRNGLQKHSSTHGPKVLPTRATLIWAGGTHRWRNPHLWAREKPLAVKHLGPELGYIKCFLILLICFKNLSEAFPNLKTILEIAWHF